MIPDIESFRLVPHMTDFIECLKIPDFSHDPYGRGPEMTLLHIGWCRKLRGCFWGPIWAPWKWNCIVGNYFPISSFSCTNWLDKYTVYIWIYSTSSKLVVILRNARRLYLHTNIKLYNCTVIITRKREHLMSSVSSKPFLCFGVFSKILRTFWQKIQYHEEALSHPWWS